MKTLKGNGPENTTFKGAINRGSSLAIESASLADVNVFGGTLFVPGGVVLNGSAAAYNTGVIEFTGGTFASGVYPPASAVISSAVLGFRLVLNSTHRLDVYGDGDAELNLAGNNFTQSAGGMTYASGVTFASGTADGIQGGAFYLVAGTATFDRCTFAHNSASTRGGGIFNAAGATVSMTSCTFASNTAGSGGGLYRAGGSAMFSACVFSGNTATSYPAFYHQSYEITMTSCVITENTATANAGTIAILGGACTMTDCVFADNHTSNGTVLWVGATTVNITGTTIHGSSGNSLFVQPNGTANVSNCDIGFLATRGVTNIAGNNVFEKVSSGTVNIASGASIALTSNMSCTAINVDGVCYVNGATVAAGVYTNIDSAGSATT